MVKQSTYTVWHRAYFLFIFVFYSVNSLFVKAAAFASCALKLILVKLHNVSVP